MLDLCWQGFSLGFNHRLFEYEYESLEYQQNILTLKNKIEFVGQLSKKETEHV